MAKEKKRDGSKIKAPTQLPLSPATTIPIAHTLVFFVCARTHILSNYCRYVLYTLRHGFCRIAEGLGRGASRHIDITAHQLLRRSEVQSGRQG